MKASVMVGVVVVLLAAMVREGSGDEDVVALPLENRRDPATWLTVGVDAWLTVGEGDWQTDFGGTLPILGSATGRSRLEWDDIDSTLVVVSAELRLGRLFKISGRYGSGSIDGGVSTDTDSLSVPELGVGNFEFSQSRADTDGDTALYDANIHFVVSSLFDEKDCPAEVSVFAGFQYYEDSLTMKNGVQTSAVGVPLFEAFPTALDSTYDFVWKGVRLGAGIDIPIQPNLSIAGQFAYVTQIDYDGEGFWNLREDFRTDGPSFEHQADSGFGFEGSLVVTYQPWPQVGLRVGYSWLEWEADDGTDVMFFADGSTADSRLSEVHSSRSGLFAGVFATL